MGVPLPGRAALVVAARSGTDVRMDELRAAGDGWGWLGMAGDGWGWLGKLGMAGDGWGS